MTRGSCEKFGTFSNFRPADELVALAGARSPVPPPQPAQPVDLAADAAPPPPPIAVTLAAAVTIAAYRRAAWAPACRRLCHRR